MPISRDATPLVRVPTLIGALLAFACLLAGCHENRSNESVLAPDTCLPLSGTRETAATFTTPQAGVLAILATERGISAIARLEGAPATDSASPIERLGTLVLLAPTRAGEPHSVRVRSADSPDIAGEVCLSVRWLPRSAAASQKAWEALAAAGRATYTNDWQPAYEAYLDAARRFDQLQRPRAAANARHAMAELAYLRLDRKRDAYALASDALAYYQGAGDELHVGLLSGLQAKALLDMPGSDLQSTLPRARALLASARRKDSAHYDAARELPRLDIMAGFLEYRLDAPERAREVFGAAARACRELRDWDCYAIASQNLALLAADGKNFAAALAAFADALRWLPPELDPKLSADIWSNYGALQGLVGLLSSSERSHAQAMRAYARLGDCQGVRRTLSRAGNLLVQIGGLSDAQSMLQRSASLDCASLLSDIPGETAAVASSSAAPAEWRVPPLRPPIPGDWCARPLETAGLATDNRLIVFNSLLWLNDALMLAGDSAAARRCLDVADRYAATARSRMRLATARGETLLASNNPLAARVDFQRALTIADEAQIPAGHEYRGHARLGIVRSDLLAGDSAATIREASATLDASIGRGDLSQTVTSLRLLAAGLRDTGQPAKAAHVLQTAADLIEAVPIDELDGEKRATYLATQHSVYAELTDLYASQAAGDESMTSLAFSTLERGRARSLRYAVAQTNADVSTAFEPPTAKYQQLLHEVVELGSPAHDASRSAALIDGLDATARRRRAAEEPLDQRQLSAVLDRLDATLVEFAIGTHDLFAFVAGHDGTRIVRLGDWAEIGSRADALLEQLRDPEAPAPAVSDAARSLAARVLWPLSDRLTKKRIIVVPDGALHTIPFGVLPWSPDSGQLLLQHAEISVAPSARFLTGAHAAKPGLTHESRVELVGDPVFRVADWRRECTAGAGGPSAVAPSMLTGWTESLPRLPGSRAEVQLIARQVQKSRPGDLVQILTGCQANPSALRRAASGPIALLHIATHARVDAQRPRLSALALTPEREGDSVASAFGLLQILGLRLQSGVVVLSACETSRGRLLPGEGVLGPAQAFLQAGATTVVATGWRIDDRTTLNLMENFYRHLLFDHLPAAASLRKAQLEESGRASPHEWAAFSLYGWPDVSI